MTPCVIKAPNPTLTIRHRPPSSVFQFYKGIEEAEAQQGQSLVKGHTPRYVGFEPVQSPIRTRGTGGVQPTHLDLHRPTKRWQPEASHSRTGSVPTAEPEAGIFDESQEGAALKKRGNSRHTWPLPQTPEGLVRGDTQLCPLSTWSRGQSYTQ